MGFLTDQDPTIKSDLITLVDEKTNLGLADKLELDRMAFGVTFDALEKVVEWVTPDYLNDNMAALLRGFMDGDKGKVKKQTLEMYEEVVDEVRNWLLERLDDEEDAPDEEPEMR